MAQVQLPFVSPALALRKGDTALDVYNSVDSGVYICRLLS